MIFKFKGLEKIHIRTSVGGLTIEDTPKTGFRILLSGNIIHEEPYNKGVKITSKTKKVIP